MYYLNNDIQTIDKYDMSKFMDMADDGVFDCLTSYFLYQIPQLPIYGYYKIKVEENRPDLLSFNLYGDTQYWWIIMWYNHFLSPYDLTVGKEIKYPSLSNINQMYVNASLLRKTGQ